MEEKKVRCKSPITFLRQSDNSVLELFHEEVGSRLVPPRPYLMSRESSLRSRN
jgi:hypothetical protein